MLTYNLKYLLKARGIKNPYTQFVKWGISRNVAHKLLANDSYVLRLDHVEILCKNLVCTPNDLLRYIPTTKPNPHSPVPLDTLIYREEDLNVHDQINQLDINQLKEVASLIEKITETPK